MPSRRYAATPDRCWTFNSTIREVNGTNSVVAKIEYARFWEEGKITLSASRTEYVISHETSSGIWRLSPASPSGAPAVIVARKPKFYRTEFRLEKNGQHFAMVPVSKWRRDYSLHKVPNANITTRMITGDAVVELKAISRQRSYDISFDEDVDLELTAFCFWLVNMIRRRDGQAASGAGASGAAGAGGGC